MNRTQICEILNISKSTISYVLSGRRNSPLAPKIKYLLQFEDNFEDIVRDPAFGELCEFVIKRAMTRKEHKEVDLAINGKNLRKFLMNDFDQNDLQYSVLVMFDKTSYIDRKMKEFINSKQLETMCDIGMRSTKKASVRAMANTLKIIHQEFWKPKINPKDEVSEVQSGG